MAGRDARAPRPARLLTEQPDLHLQTYENELVCDAVARVREALEDTIKELADRGLGAESFSAAIGHGSRYKRDRIAHLAAEWWGGGEVDAALERLAARIAVLRPLLRDVQGLQADPRSIVRQIKPRPPRELRMTNVFRGDDRYRAAAIIWGSVHTDRLTDAQRAQRANVAARGHARFVQLCVTRAAGLVAPRWPAPRLTLREEGVDVVFLEGQPPVRVRAAAAEGTPRDVGPKLGAHDVDLVIHRSGEQAGSAPWTRQDPATTFWGTSPRDVLAIEQLAVLLRRRVLAPALLAVPVVVAARDGDDLLHAARVPFTRLDERRIAVQGVAGHALDREIGRMTRGAHGVEDESRLTTRRRLADAVRSAGEDWRRALACPDASGCLAAGPPTLLESTLDRLIIRCGAGHAWGRIACSQRHPVCFFAGADDRRELRASEHDAVTTLGASLVSTLEAVGEDLCARCVVCEELVRLPSAATAGPP